MKEKLAPYGRIINLEGQKEQRKSFWNEELKNAKTLEALEKYFSDICHKFYTEVVRLLEKDIHPIVSSYENSTSDKKAENLKDSLIAQTFSLLSLRNQWVKNLKDIRLKLAEFEQSEAKSDIHETLNYLISNSSFNLEVIQHGAVKDILSEIERFVKVINPEDEE